mgnify:CR=1 FL=1
MSEKFEVVQERLSGDDFRVYKSAMITEGIYFETEDGEGFTIKVGPLLQALHNLGFDVLGFKPKETLQEQLVTLLSSTTYTDQRQRAEKIIELVQGFKP